MDEDFEDDFDDDFDDGEIWYRDYDCPNCGHGETIPCSTRFAPVVFCPVCGTMMI